MGNSSASAFVSFKVKFSRETPNDFYVSGDRVQGIIQVITNVNDNDWQTKYGPLSVDLVGELNDFKPSAHRVPNGKEVQVFFRKRAQLIKLPNDNQRLENNGLRSYRWVFDGLLDSILPSSLPPDEDSEPCICYYVLAFFRYNVRFHRKFAFVVFTRSPTPAISSLLLSNQIVEASLQYKDVKVHGTLPNNGLAVPGRNLMLQIEIENPMKITIKSIRATLKQYRHIIDEETSFIIFSTILPGFKPNGFSHEYRQSTYELPIPLEKCRVMAPTSSYKSVRYELHIHCRLDCLWNNYFILKLPVRCTIDHQQILKPMNELKSLRDILQYPIENDEDNPPPSYEDFMVSQILPRYKDLFHS